MCFKPNKHFTIDEQLLPCKSRCSFIQYMPKKPDKFGIKFWILADVETKYVCAGSPYLGKCTAKKPAGSVGETAVIALMGPLLNKGYCLTTDNFFTSISLSNYLYKHQTTLVGTIKENRKEIAFNT